MSQKLNAWCGFLTLTAEGYGLVFEKCSHTVFLTVSVTKDPLIRKDNDDRQLTLPSGIT